MDMPATVIESVSDHYIITVEDEMVIIQNPSSDRYQLFPTHRQTLLPMTGYIPFLIQNSSGKDNCDVYIRIQGINPITNSLCYLTADRNGVTSYSNDDEYSVPLSALPPGNDYRVIQTLPLESARLFVSVDNKTSWHELPLTHSSDNVVMVTVPDLSTP